MASLPAKSNCRGLQTLPLEVLLEISKYIPDFPSLNGFFTLLTAHDQGASFIQNFQSKIFANVIRFDREDEIKRIVTAVISLRNDTTEDRPFSEDGFVEQDFVWVYLLRPEIEYIRMPHYLPWFSDPVAPTRDIVRISEDIGKLVEVFLNACIIKPSGQDDAPPISSTELYRTRRAFWHFQLFYDMCHVDKNAPYAIDREHESPLARRFPGYRTRRIQMMDFLNMNRLEPTNLFLPAFLTFFLRNIGNQEIQEFDTVHCYMALLISKLRCAGHRNSSRLKSQPALLQRLIDDFGNQRDDPHESVDGLEFSLGVPRFALQRGHEHPPDLEVPRAAVTSCALDMFDTTWGWHFWDKVRRDRRSLNPTGAFCSVDSKSYKILKECKHAQSTYLDDWVSGIHYDNLELEEGISSSINKSKGQER